MGLPMPMNNNEKMSPESLKEFMDHNGISNRELAEILGVTQHAVKFWITGKREFNVTNSKIIRLFIKYPQLIKEF